MRRGRKLTPSLAPRDRGEWRWRDVVYCRRPDGWLHWGIVSDKLERSGLPMVILKVGIALGEDCLGWWEVIGRFRYPKVKRVWKGVCGVKRVAGAVLAGLGAIMLAFCAWFAVFELIPAYVKMRQSGDGAAFGLGVTVLLWWFLPASAALLVGGVLLRRPAGSVPAVPARPLAVVAWAGAAALLLWVVPWVVPWVIGGLSSARQWYGCSWAELLRLAVQDLMLGLPVLVLALVLGWSGVRLWRGV